MTPRAVSSENHFKAISAGAQHTCAIATTGTGYCWGADDHGELGDGPHSASAFYQLPAGADWTQISAGSTHSCGVRADGSLYCWGANDNGQLGIGVEGQPRAITRVTLPAPVVSVSAGTARTCARTIDDRTYCWGADWTARDDNGWEIWSHQTTPKEVADAHGMRTVSVGAFTTCGTDAGGSAFCWEANPRGEMGNGTQSGSIAPKPVSALNGMTHLSAGLLQTCGVSATGQAYCWGDATFGQLGVDPSQVGNRCDWQNLPCSTTPVLVAAGTRFVQISTGLGSHVCGVTADGDVLCWGQGNSGQLGDGSTASIVSTPARIKGSDQYLASSGH